MSEFLNIENHTGNKMTNLPVRSLILGFVLLVIALVISFWTYDFNFSEETFREMFLKNPVLIIFMLMPAILFFVIKNFSKDIETEKQKLEEALVERDRKIGEIANFAVKIGEGDLTANIEVSDENDTLSKSLLIMRDNLLDTGDKEKQQNWITRGKDIISDVLRLHNDLESLAYDVIVNIIKYTGIIQGAFYIYDEDKGKLINIATYAYNRKKYITQEFEIGRGLIGQAAFEMDIIYRTEIPEYYVSITSGLLKDKKPGSVLIMPLINDEKLNGVIEFADVEDNIPDLTRAFIKEISVMISQTVFNLKVNIRTEKLLSDAQAMTKELRENEEQLRENAEEMRVTHEELEKANELLEGKITEVQNAQKRLHSLLENASEVITIYDRDKTVKYESPSVKNILGYDAESVIGKKGFTTLDKRARDLYDEAFTKLLDNPREPQSVELTFKKANGEEIWLESLGRNLIDNSAIAGIIFNTRDITQRKIAEKEQRMRGQMQALSENSPDMILRLGILGRIFYANPMVEVYTGQKPSNLNKADYKEIGFEPVIKSLFADIITKLVASHEQIIVEVSFPTALGERIMTVNAIPEFNENTDLETILVVAHDITEQKQIELEIKDKNKKIEDSINYAQRIQTSILPDTKYIQEFLPNSFIFYKPRDVISGDFPWFFERKGIIYIAAVDCTGHGVPGALLSFIGYFILNNVVDHERVLTSGQILDELHACVRTTLKQEREGAEARDGMDIALCKIDKSKNILEYSGAHRPLYLLRGKELLQFKGNPKAIGGIPVGKKVEADFVTHEINYQEGDKIFFFSDGLPDQVGGEDNRKYQAKRIREALIENSDFPLSKFNGYFARDFKKWKGENKQIDDVLLIGIEF